MTAADRSLFQRILEFLNDEAEQRSDAGSAMSDYEREPRELAEELATMLDSWTDHPHQQG